jgi:septal ring factor EnvC (AmiA/AmiB activator)
MIDAVVYAALGFFLASVLAVLVLPAFWNRAARLTRRQIESSMPLTIAEIEASKAQLRAEFAVEIRRLELALDKAKTKAIRELVETSKGRVRIDQLSAELGEVKAALQQAENANRALERTLQHRLPELEGQVKLSAATADEIEAVNTELRHRLGVQTEALRAARETLRAQRGEIERLRDELQTDAKPIKRLFGSSDKALSRRNRQLVAELSGLREELARFRQQEENDALLRDEMRRLSQQILRAAEAPDAPSARRASAESRQAQSAEKAQADRIKAEATYPSPAGMPAGIDAATADETGNAAPKPAAARRRGFPLAGRKNRGPAAKSGDAGNGASKRPGLSLAERLAARAEKAADNQTPRERGEAVPAEAAESERR